MISIAKRIYKKESSHEFVSKRDQIELVATMLKNNLKGYAAIHRYNTEINPKLNGFKTYEEIEEYISSLDYLNRLYFYSAGLLELTLFEHYLIEKNPEIMEGTRNAEMLRTIFNKNSEYKGLNANNYIDIVDIKAVVLNVFCDMYTSKAYEEDDRIRNLLLSYQKNFETSFKGVLSTIDVFANMLVVEMNSVTKAQYENGVDTLKMRLRLSGGKIENGKIDKEGFKYTVEKLSQIIPDSAVEEYKQILIENNEMISLVYEIIDTEYTSDTVIEVLDNYLDEKQFSK